MRDRTALQIEANEIDIEMFRLISRLSRFERSTNNLAGKYIRETIQALTVGRATVRMMMSTEDRESTS